MQAMVAQHAPARSLAAVAAAIARSCIIIPLQSSPEVEDRLDLIRPCLAAQAAAAEAGLPAHTSAGLVPPDVHVMSGAAKHQWQQPIATLQPRAARRAQRGGAKSEGGEGRLQLNRTPEAQPETHYQPGAETAALPSGSSGWEPLPAPAAAPTAAGYDVQPVPSPSGPTLVMSSPPAGALPPTASPACESVPQPAASQATSQANERVGTVGALKRSYGFINQDGGGSGIFMLPSACPAFGNILPATSTRVLFCVVTDPKTGKPMADNVRPEPYAAPEAMSSGTMGRSLGRFGFIKRDEGGPDMFVMSTSCPAFDLKLPATGARVVYDVVIDSKTRRPRANGVKPESATSPGDSSQCRFSHRCPQGKRQRRRKAWRQVSPARSMRDALSSDV